MNKLSEELKEVLDSVDKIGEDGEIDKEVFPVYFDLIITNIRENNKRITRNSFLLLLSLLLFIILVLNKDIISTVNLLFTTIEDTNFLLNTIPVFFSFIYFKNVCLWANNANLKHKFDDLSRNFFKIGFNTDTKAVILPFSLVQHSSYYLMANKKFKGLFKVPGVIVMLVFSLTPLIFEGYSIYHIVINNTPNLISIVSGVLVGLLMYLTVAQLLSFSNKD